MKRLFLIALTAAGCAAGLLLVASVSIAGEGTQGEGTQPYHREVKKMGDSLNRGLGAAGKGLGVRSKGLRKNLSPYSSRSFGSRGEGDSSALRAAHEGAFASQRAASETAPVDSQAAESNEVAAAVEPAKPDQAPPAAK